MVHLFKVNYHPPTLAHFFLEMVKLTPDKTNLLEAACALEFVEGKQKEMLLEFVEEISA